MDNKVTVLASFYFAGKRWFTDKSKGTLKVGGPSNAFMRSAQVFLGKHRNHINR